MVESQARDSLALDPRRVGSSYSSSAACAIVFSAISQCVIFGMENASVLNEESRSEAIGERAWAENCLGVVWVVLRRSPGEDCTALQAICTCTPGQRKESSRDLVGGGGG